MTLHPQRLRRILRKYRLDQRIARIELACAERERLSLIATDARLAQARTGLTVKAGETTGRDLASCSEWADRLASSAMRIAPAVAQSEIARAEAALAEGRAAQRVERLEGRIGQADRATAQAESRHLPPSRPGRRPLRNMPQ